MYFNVGRRFLSTQPASLATPIRLRSLNPNLALGALLVCFFLTCGSFFLDDFFIIASWLFN